jgi:hypothetical protein
MSQIINLQIEITEDEFKHLKGVALTHGFDTAEAYVKSLALEPTKDELLNDIREGILAAQHGEPMPTVDEMWAELERNDDEETN